MTASRPRGNHDHSGENPFDVIEPQDSGVGVSSVNAEVSAEKMKPEALFLLAFMWGAYFLNYCDRQAVFSMFPSLKTDLKMAVHVFYLKANK